MVSAVGADVVEIRVLVALETDSACRKEPLRMEVPKMKGTV